MSDASDPGVDRYIEIVRRMTAEQKLVVAQQLRATAWELKAAGLRAQHPKWSEEEVQAKVREIFLYASG